MQHTGTVGAARDVLVTWPPCEGMSSGNDEHYAYSVAQQTLPESCRRRYWEQRWRTCRESCVGVGSADGCAPEPSGMRGLKQANCICYMQHVT